ncbi:MAG TPA: 3-keto-5-aminohexanoate cleavage protein [Rhizomicrobium sp.]|jgi:hypothetical protein|nr:3-keto-5-aminohexanoate cleavage protein [Rhizomicrobium sp.]
MAKTWLEVALNGGLTRESQPHVPVSVEEIVADGIACVKAGASIVHLHSYDIATGRQKDDVDLYARIIDGIRSKVDAIVYPTVIGGTRGASEVTVVGPERYKAVVGLAERGLLEWTVCDPGSTNTALYAGVERGWKSSVYVNTESDIRTGLALALEHGLVPSYAIYEPGFLRLGSALAKRYPKLKTPVYRFMFSDRMTFGFAPRGLRARRLSGDDGGACGRCAVDDRRTDGGCDAADRADGGQRRACAHRAGRCAPPQRAEQCAAGRGGGHGDRAGGRKPCHGGGHPGRPRLASPIVHNPRH